MIHVPKSAETSTSTSLEATPGELTPSAPHRAASTVRERPLPRRPRSRAVLRWITIAVVLLGIEFVYVFIVSAGKFVNWPTYNLNYDMQAEGFRKGHLYLPLEPPAELLAKENPLDPANANLWFADLSFYKGKYYMYWGPLPALALAAVKATMKIGTPVGDQYPVFILYSVYLVAGALLIDRVARRLFPGLRLGAVRLPSLGVVRGSRLWCACSFGVLATVPALPSIGVFDATMRYLADIAGGLLLFATWGAWSFLCHIRHRKWACRVVGVGLSVLAAATIILGLLIGYQGYIGHFQTYNPKLHEQVTRSLSRCK